MQKIQVYLKMTLSSLFHKPFVITVVIFPI